MISRFLLALCCVVGLGGAVTAQDENTADALIVEDVQIVTRIDLYGQQQLAAEGKLANNGSTAFTKINLLADVYNANGETVGEGFGFLVDACGTALVDYALQPGQTQTFSVPLELYEDGVKVDRVDIVPQATQTEPVMLPSPAALDGITPVVRDEVVALEWIDNQNLRFGAGCDSAVFTALKWYEYDIESATVLEAPHPKAALVTDALLKEIGLSDPFVYDHSHLSFAPDARRLVYQNDLNALITAEPDGSFKRVLYSDQYNRSLQGFLWLPEGRFLAYYFGAYGDPVYYLTASVDGERISAPLDSSVAIPSMIVPGATPDGLRAVIGGTFDGVTGYYLKSTLYSSSELLFESDLPGNNWPAPVFSRQSDGAAYIYIAHPVEGQARLQCFDMQTRELHDLTPLPLQLTTDSRAWMWLSPEMNRMALAANGVSGGLWLVDLSQFQGC